MDFLFYVLKVYSSCRICFKTRLRLFPRELLIRDLSLHHSHEPSTNFRQVCRVRLGPLLRPQERVLALPLEQVFPQAPEVLGDDDGDGGGGVVVDAPETRLTVVVQMKRRMTTSRDGTSCVVVGSGCLNATQARTESWWEIVWWHRFSGGRPVSPSLHSRREPTLPALQRCPPARPKWSSSSKKSCPVSEFRKNAKE